MRVSRESNVKMVLNVELRVMKPDDRRPEKSRPVVGPLNTNVMIGPAELASPAWKCATVAGSMSLTVMSNSLATNAMPIGAHARICSGAGCSYPLL